MKLFTVKEGEATEGVLVERFHLKGADLDIPAILVGEEGRGRSLGVVPVRLNEKDYGTWMKEGAVVVKQGVLGETRLNKPKVLADRNDGSREALVVFRTHIGYRGGNSHTGDRIGWRCAAYDCNAEGEGPRPKPCPECGSYRTRLVFAEFPGKVLMRGVIAQGDAGYMGSGEQLVVVLPPGSVARTGYSGRLYDEPHAHYHFYDGERIISATWQERTVADLF